MGAYPHLLPQVAERMEDSELARIEFARSDRWIAYPVARE